MSFVEIIITIGLLFAALFLIVVLRAMFELNRRASRVHKHLDKKLRAVHTVGAGVHHGLMDVENMFAGAHHLIVRALRRIVRFVHQAINSTD